MSFVVPSYTSKTWVNGASPAINASNLQDIDSVVAALGGKTITETSDILNAVYPVGSIYISANSTNPSTLFGGAWTRITDTFLLAAGSTYPADDGTHTTATAGAASVTLTVDEIPAHNHPGTASTAGSHSHSISDVKWVGSDGNTMHSSGNALYAGTNYTGYSGNHTHTISTEDIGGGEAHNNMPPYLAVYVWKRTA